MEHNPNHHDPSNMQFGFILMAILFVFSKLLIIIPDVPINILHWLQAIAFMSTIFVGLASFFGRHNKKNEEVDNE